MDQKPLDVAFDISTLAGIRAGNFLRTGIFRVVEQLALQLGRREDLALRFCVSNVVLSPEHVAAQVAEAHPSLARVPAVPVWQPELEQRARAFQRLRKREGEALGTKMRRFVARRRLEWLQRGATPDLSALPPGSIFHSSWEPLPPRGPFDARGVRRALTVYDMTPVLFPHFFDDNRVFGAIMASVTPEDHILAISECTKRDFCEVTKHDPARVHVTPLAADPAMFRPVADPDALAAARAEYGIPPGRYLLSVNTIQPRKNLEHAIRAFARLVRDERIDDLSFVLVGDRGWKTGAIDAALREAGLPAGRIVLTGYVPDEDLAALYAGAQAFIYVSHYEGFGLPPLEAMQCGVPVIASDNSSLPEVVGGAGILVPAADADALCDAMLRIHRDEGLRASLAAQAQARARQFSWERCADLTVAAYRRVLAA